MNRPAEDENFKPRGAIAFFALMIGFYIVFWVFFYLLMLGRR